MFERQVLSQYGRKSRTERETSTELIIGLTFVFTLSAYRTGVGTYICLNDFNRETHPIMFQTMAQCCSLLPRT